jgi:hypothetical protein
MSYSASIPVASDPILRSQRQIKANFQEINQAFANNHVPLQQQDFKGMHNVLTLRPQSGDPTTTATEVALYNKLVSSVPEIFYGPASSATPIQMTYQSISTDPAAVQQYSFVAGPFVVYGGLIKNPTQGQTVTLTPGTTLLYVDLIMADVVKPQDNFVTTAVPTSISGNSFNISFGARSFPGPFSSSLKFDVYYFAIGL